MNAPRGQWSDMAYLPVNSQDLLVHSSRTLGVAASSPRLPIDEEGGGSLLVEDAASAEARWKRAATCGFGVAVLLVLGLAGRDALRPWPRGGEPGLAAVGDAVASNLVSMVDSSLCGVLWGQCGGDKFDGAKCCIGGNVCQAKPLADYPTFMQCRPKPPPACEDAVIGSTCFNSVSRAQQGVAAHPDWYHGLSTESSFKEFQEFEASFNKDSSQCSHPCSPGTCHYVFKYEGCDEVNEWMCKQPDNSLAYQCCCEYFHKQANLTGPAKPSAELAKAVQDAKGVFPVLFCTALCMASSYEVDLLRAQYAQGKLGLFGCNHWAVYSNSSIVLSPDSEYPFAMATVIYGSLAAKLVPGLLPSDPWTVSNTDVFLRFWSKVAMHQNALVADFTVKVDPDTVWIPGRLRAMLLMDKAPLNQPDPPKGLYLNDCHFGMHGPIEVLSRNALLNYKSQVHQCIKGEPATHGQEDWYLRNCFELLGVAKVNAYNLLFEGQWSCDELPSSGDPEGPPCFAPQVAFHPFKDAGSWLHCHLEAENHPWAMQMELLTEPPGPANERHT